MHQYLSVVNARMDDVIESSNGSGFMHKSKLNSNGSFSVGKTWNLAEVHAIQVLNVRFWLRQMFEDSSYGAK